MAKKAPRKRRFNLRRVRFSTELALATLGSDTALTVSLTGAGDHAYRAVVIKGSWNQTGLTAGEGPVTVGYAHSDYTVAEIKECLEAFAAISQGDKIAQEKAGRIVRTVGTFRSEANNALNDGKPISTRLNWLMAIGDSINMFCFNEEQGALSTGALINHQGDLWVRDST